MMVASTMMTVLTLKPRAAALVPPWQPRLTELVVLEQSAKLQPGGGIGHGLASQINAHKPAQTGAVVQGLLRRPDRPG